MDMWDPFIKSVKNNTNAEIVFDKFHIAKNEAEAKKYWTIRRESFNLLRKSIKGKRTAPFIDDFIVQVEKLPEFFPLRKT